VNVSFKSPFENAFLGHSEGGFLNYESHEVRIGECGSPTDRRLIAVFFDIFPSA
jgi:hypothetical protein